MAELQNVFSWSKSRDEQFRECKRKYYYDKYASWGGWESGAVPLTRSAYVLKNLKNRWAWKGEVVHHLVENVLKTLRSGRSVSPEGALAELTETMRRDFRSSKARRHWEDPKRNMGLFEHEYARTMTDDAWRQVHDGAAECLRNFFGSAFYAELVIDDKSQWLVIEDLEEFEFGGAKIYVKLDFARRKDGLVHIYDWKTGKNDAVAARVQIGAYAIYAMRRWKVPLESVRAYLVNLGKPDPRPDLQALDAALIAETEGVMSQSILAMRALLADPARNVPKPPAEFGFTTDPRACDFCSFQKICEKFVNPSSITLPSGPGAVSSPRPSGRRASRAS